MIRLVYASSATVPFSSAELAALLKGARENNSKLHVSGMLLFHEKSFLQVLEGESEVVKTLYAKIGRDPRHDRVLMLGSFEIKERAFEEWSMGSLELSALGDSKLEGLSDFMQGGVLGLQSNQALVERILNGFRDGRYRQHVR